MCTLFEAVYELVPTFTNKHIIYQLDARCIVKFCNVKCVLADIVRVYLFVDN